MGSVIGGRILSARQVPEAVNVHRSQRLYRVNWCCVQVPEAVILVTQVPEAAVYLLEL